jgi:hypothetical protein
MVKSPYAIGLKPDYAGRRHPHLAIYRMAVASLVTKHRGGNIADFVEENYPGDDIVPVLIKAASLPADTSTAGWASDLAPFAVNDFLLNLGPASAGSAVLARGLGPLSFGDGGGVMVPGVSPSASLVGFVGQGLPIPVRMLSIDGAALMPKKFAVIVSYTRELLNASVPSIEKVVRQTLNESVGLAIDTALFGSLAATTTRPAGLRNGITATALSGLTGVGDAMVADLGLLVAAVAPVAAGAPILIVGNAKQIAKLRLRLFGRSIDGLEFFVSSAIEDAAVIAIASKFFAGLVMPLRGLILRSRQQWCSTIRLRASSLSALLRLPVRHGRFIRRTALGCVLSWRLTGGFHRRRESRSRVR